MKKILLLCIFITLVLGVIFFTLLEKRYSAGFNDGVKATLESAREYNISQEKNK